MLQDLQILSLSPSTFSGEAEAQTVRDTFSPGVSSRPQRTRTQEMKFNPTGLLRERSVQNQVCTPERSPMLASVGREGSSSSILGNYCYLSTFFGDLCPTQMSKAKGIRDVMDMSQVIPMGTFSGNRCWYIPGPI